MYDNRLNITIRIEGKQKWDYLPLLIIGDESEKMIARYIDRGTLYVAEMDAKPVGVCVTTEESDNITEVKNLAVEAEYRRKGIGRALLTHIEGCNRGKTVILGTGETPSTLRFYRNCGYQPFRRIRDFFTQNYPDQIVEEGVILRDMIYLRKEIAEETVE